MAKIGIIGAGYTGLTAAYELQKLGHQVTIFEKNPHVGGLAAGVELGGTSIERAYHHLFQTDVEIISLVEELGISDRLQWYPSSMSIYWQGKFYPFNGALDLVNFTPLRFPNRIRAGLLVLFLKYFKNWETLKRVTAYTWLKRWAGKQVTDVIWEPLLRGKFHEYFDKVSAAWLWARVHIRANSRDGGEKLGYFTGGFHVVMEALLTKLAQSNNPVEIVTGANIKKIISSPKPKIILDNGESEFDAVLAAIPPRIFGNLADISETEKTKLNQINYLGAACLILATSQNLSDFYWHNINDVNIPFCAFIHHTKLLPKEWYGDQYVYYLGAYLPHDHPYMQMTEAEVVADWFKFLKQIKPEFDQSLVSTQILSRLPFAQHIVDVEYAQKIPAYQTALPNVWLSHFTQIFPEDRGTNYAVREGRKVAALIDKQLHHESA